MNSMKGTERGRRRSEERKERAPGVGGEERTSKRGRGNRRYFAAITHHGER